jgi:hypothetical protein
VNDLVPIFTVVAVAVLSAVVMGRLIQGQKKRVADIELLLRERGGMTLDEIARVLKTNVFMKGYLMQALDRMAAEGKLSKTPPPQGHPALRFALDTKYSLRE